MRLNRVDSNTYDRFRPCRTHQARLESFIAGESILNRNKRESYESQRRQKSTKTNQQRSSLIGEKTRIAMSSQGWDWTGSIPTLTTGFVLVGLIRQDWNRSLQENQFSIETREKAMKVNEDKSQRRQTNSDLAWSEKRLESQCHLKGEIEQGRFQHLRPVSSLSDSSGKTGIVHCRRINSQSKQERKLWKSTKTKVNEDKPTAI